MSTKKILAAALAVLIILVGLGIGIFYNVQELMNRPGTATQEARKAVAQRDLKKFNQYVDTDKILEQAAEQILTAHINSTVAPTAYSMDELQNRYDELKPEFIAAAHAALNEYISTGRVTFPKNLGTAQKFLKDSGATSCEIKSITKPHLEGHAQYSTVIFYNDALKFNFELELEIKDTPDGGRQIVRAEGFENFYSGYRRALRKKLDSLNAPIGRQMDDIFKIKSFAVKNAGGDEYGFSQTLNLEVKADIKSDKPLAKIIGNVILSRDDRESVAPFTIDVSDNLQGVQTFNLTKTLNPFKKTDSDAMKHGFRKKDIHLEVTEIIFADGTNLKMLDSLPE